ncbi:MAG: xanthine dehydrogenase family protein molybdopterin-binding subunit [Pseudomonadota bacterium]
MTEPTNQRLMSNRSNSRNPTRRTVLAGTAAAVAQVTLGGGATAQPKPGPLATKDSLARLPDSLGASLPRRNGRLLVRGVARFAAEHTYPRMIYGALVYSTIPRGTIHNIVTTAAESSPGVVRVMTHKNAPRMAPPESFFGTRTGMAGSALPVMQDGEVYWNGQPVAVILAETQEQADYAATLVEVSYDIADAVTSFDEAADAAVPADYAGKALRYVAGNAEPALADAAVSVDLAFSTPRHNHNQIEPHAVTVAWQDGRLRMHDCTQSVAMSAVTIAKVFGLKRSDVHLTAESVGGGFGGKTLWQYHILAAAASRLVNRPVRMTLTREGVFRVCGGRAPTRQRVALGANRDGRLTAMIHTGTTVKIAQNVMTEPLIDASRHMYRSDTMHLDVRVGTMDMLANTFMRAPGSAVGTVPLETALDELAEKLGMDPIELRIRNEPDVDPTTGKAYSQRALVAAYREGARRFGWQPRSGQRLGRREGEWLVGTGMAAAYYPYKRFPGSAARITFGRDGRALIALPGHEGGMGMETATAAIAADLLGLNQSNVQVRYGDSTLPGSIIAAASQQTAAIGASLAAAGAALVVELANLVPRGSALHGQPAKALMISEGSLSLIANPSRRIAITDLLEWSGRTSVSAEGRAAPPTEVATWSMHSTGAVFLEVRVNAVTGELRISRVTGVYDCGRILNPKLAASQFRGGIIMSLGMAMMENTHFDERSGRIMNPSFAQYYVPSHLDVPEIDVAWTGVPDPRAPNGARGIGEIGMNGASAAVANAVYDATGKRIRDLPITLDKLL